MCCRLWTCDWIQVAGFALSAPRSRAQYNYSHSALSLHPTHSQRDAEKHQGSYGNGSGKRQCGAGLHPRLPRAVPPLRRRHRRRRHLQRRLVVRRRQLAQRQELPRRGRPRVQLQPGRAQRGGGGRRRLQQLPGLRRDAHLHLGERPRDARPWDELLHLQPQRPLRARDEDGRHCKLKLAAASGFKKASRGCDAFCAHVKTSIKYLCDSVRPVCCIPELLT
ncbi:hypothetical protein ACQJBY_033308 [Aegilops geniculata]